MSGEIKTNEVWIKGVTSDGRRFRPSDWAERLAGVMAQFRPNSKNMPAQRYIDYSPWCVPCSDDSGTKIVIVNIALKENEPMAWNFVMGFAKDNDLQVIHPEA